MLEMLRDARLTHMPFLADDGNGGVVLLFCSTPADGKPWKLCYVDSAGRPRRLKTGLPRDYVECCPAAWHDAAGWHVSCIAGNSPSAPLYQLYVMHGPTLDELAPPEVVTPARGGFVFRDLAVWCEVRDTIYIDDAGQQSTVELPGTFLYRVSLVSDDPNRLLITGQRIIESDFWDLEFNRATGEQRLLSCAGEPAYKCAVRGARTLYTTRHGNGHDSRKIVEGPRDAQQVHGLAKAFPLRPGVRGPASRQRAADQPHLSAVEVAELLPELSDPKLIGNQLAALFSAIGIPPCSGCARRKQWLNKAHAWLRGQA